MNRRFWLEWLGAFLACAAMCAFFQFHSPYLQEPDVYFHIKAAELLRRHGFFREGFPWAHFSLWRDAYSDGCPLYHLLLIPFTFGDLAFGAKAAGVLFSAFAFSSFYMILGLNRVSHRIYWFWLLLAGGGFFWWRLLDVRPQVLSSALLMWSLHFLINGRVRAFALLCFVYPFAYVAAFLPLVFAFVRWVYLRAVGEEDGGRILLAGLGGYALGMLLHPYFPKNLLFFYVQNILVVWAAVAQHVDLSLGGEIFPMDTRQLLAAQFPLLFHLAGALFVFMHRRTPLSRRTLTLFPIMLTAAGMALISKRFVEYAVPVATLFCAFAGSDLLAGLGYATYLGEVGVVALVLFALGSPRFRLLTWAFLQHDFSVAYVAAGRSEAAYAAAMETAAGKAGQTANGNGIQSALSLIRNYLSYDLDEMASSLAISYLGSLDKSVIAGLAFRLSAEGQHYAALRLARDAVNRGAGTLYPELYGLVYPKAWNEIIAMGAAIPGIPEALAYGIIRSESVFDPKAVSYAGAVGLSQLMPATAAETARGLKMSSYSLTDPADNVRIGLTYYSYMLARFGGKPMRAMFAYNAGPSRMMGWSKESGELPDDILLETLHLAQPRQYAKNIVQASLAYGKIHYGIAPRPLLDYLVNAAPLETGLDTAGTQVEAPPVAVPGTPAETAPPEIAEPRAEEPGTETERHGPTM